MALYVLTLAEIKLTVGIDATDTADDSLLTLWAEGLQGRFDEHLRRQLLREAGKIERFNGDFRALYLAAFPVEAVTEVAVDDERAFGAGTVLAADEFVLDPDRGRLLFGKSLSVFGSRFDRWQDGFQNIRITYDGGFVAAGVAPGAGQTAMPEAIRRAFAIQFGFEWRNREQLGLIQLSAEGTTAQQGSQPTLAIRDRALMPEVQTSLQPFRRLIA